MNSTIIELAINGLTAKERNANVPITPGEIAADSQRLLEAEAAIIHNHIEDIHLSGEAAAQRYSAGWAPVLAAHPDAILCPTTVVAPTIGEKIAHPRLCSSRGARMGALDPGSVNIANTASDGLPGDRRFSYANGFDEIDASGGSKDKGAFCEECGNLRHPGLIVGHGGTEQTVHQGVQRGAVWRRMSAYLQR